MLDPKQHLKTRKQFRLGIRQAIAALGKFPDVHVHIMPLCMGEEFAIQGLAQAGAYHYNDGEAGAKSRRSRAEQASHKQRPVMEQALANFHAILGNGELPVSTATLGWFRMAKALGLDPSQNHRDILREWESKFGKMAPQDYHDMVRDKSCVSSVVSTQSIFNPAEAALYRKDEVLKKWDPWYEIAIRFDEALRNQSLLSKAAAFDNFAPAGGSHSDRRTKSALTDLFKFHYDRFANIAPVRYISLSLGAEDRFYKPPARPGDPRDEPEETRFATIMHEVVIPLARKYKIPIFLMPYVERRVNPEAGASGDCVATGNFDDIVRFVANHPDVSFILTTLHPSGDYNGCFLTRCCPNLRLIGFWWGNLNSNEVRRQIQQRMEFIGTAWFGLNSDARILDQLLYKWDDFFDDLEHVLATIILPKVIKAVPVTVERIQATIRQLQDADQLYRKAA